MGVLVGVGVVTAAGLAIWFIADRVVINRQMTYKPPPGSVPPFIDMAKLCWHVSMSEDTIEREINAGRFPGPRKGKCGKRLWVWKEVEEYLARPDDDAPASEALRMREAAKRYANG